MGTDAIRPSTTSVKVSATDELEVWTVGDGTPVVLVHGALFRSLLRPLADALAAAGAIQAIWYHRRGYRGRPGAPTTVADQARDITTIMDALDIDSAHLVGHSAASCFVLECVTQAPDRVRSAVLLDFVMPAQVPSGPMFVEAMMPVAEMAQAGDLKGAATTMLAGLGCTQELMDRTIPGSWSEMLQDATTWFQYDMPALNEWTADGEKVKATDMPMAFLSVGHLPPFRETGELLREWRADLTMLEIPTTEHFFPVAATKEAAAVLGEWIGATQDRA